MRVLVAGDFENFSISVGSCFWLAKSVTRQLLNTMGLRFPPQKHGQYFFVTTTFNNWTKYGDISGVYDVLASSLTFVLNKYGARLIAYVFMPSHIHMLIFIDGKDLGNLMRDFKKYIAQKGFKNLGIYDKDIWMPRFDRQVITSEVMLRTKIEYIHYNPVKAELSENADAWIWSSASDYKGSIGGSLTVWTNWYE